MPSRRAAPPGVPPPAVAGTAAFAKFMHVLQLVADAPEPPTAADLTRDSGFPRPTLHRIVAALQAEGLLCPGSRAGTLVLGPRLIELASRSWGRSDLRLAASEALEQLRDTTGETVHLAVHSGGRMVYIDKLESPSAVRMASRIGASVALHSTAVGKAYLAGLPAARREALLASLELTALTPKTVTTLQALRRQLDTVQAVGWSVDDEENEADIQCFGAAIVGDHGMPVAAVSVSTLRFRQKPDPQLAYVVPLLAACRAISARIATTPTQADGALT